MLPLAYLARQYNLKPETFAKQYREHLSDFRTWECEYKPIEKGFILYPQNLGEQICIDETHIHDDVYTIVTNPKASAQKSLVAVIRGVKSKNIVEILQAIPLQKRYSVKHVMLDGSQAFDWATSQLFPNAQKSYDRFHLQKLWHEALSTIRIQLKELVLKEENELQQSNKKPKRCSNGETKRQLLTRSKYLLAKPSERWSKTQKNRAEVLFFVFPELQKAYEIVMQLREVYEKSRFPGQAEAGFYRVCKKALCSPFEPLKQRAIHTINNLHKYVSYFPLRFTNAFAENFNSRLKYFRTLSRGISCFSFFLFRISIFFASP